uniref:NADH:ubiquinone oxidoreductase intermediate-associated protein 30 domain-containing protein n=2 Tax=Lygus hesperus TaxID=30085 RepID=A0A0K8TCY6_LYGHE
MTMPWKTIFKSPLCLILLSLYETAAHRMEENGVLQPNNTEGKMLWDFTQDPTPDLTKWFEESDVVREPGKSKAVLVLQKSRLFQRAVFFTMLNPQPNGAGFAGMRTLLSGPDTLNLDGYSTLQLRVRGQGQNFHYKICLHHMGMNYEPNPTYEQTFKVPSNEFTTINLPLASFEPYYRGRKMNETEVGPLKKSEITSFGLQIFGGVYLPEKQQGTSSLEIDWVKAV